MIARSFSDRDLAAPTGISPAPATEQKQHQDNDQDSYHVAPHLSIEAGQTFETSIPLLHCATFYEVAQNDV
jgi:hypothetical protein